MKPRIKWDGHTHSELCPHGSGDQTEQMIKRAIELGFTHYSITEHAPLPDGLIANGQLQKELTLQSHQIEDYFYHVRELKQKYRSQIVIYSGLEVDYLPNHIDYTQDLLSQWNDYIDDWILSLHFLEGEDGTRCVDFTPEDFREGLIQYYGSTDEVHFAYWRAMEKMLTVEFKGVSLPRIGHLGLINKFTLPLPLESSVMEEVDFFEPIFKRIQNRGLAIDVNIAGFHYPLSKLGYLTTPMQYWCNLLDLKMVYGSDAHSIKAVGRSYQEFEAISQGVASAPPTING